MRPPPRDSRTRWGYQQRRGARRPTTLTLSHSPRGAEVLVHAEAAAGAAAEAGSRTRDAAALRSGIDSGRRGRATCRWPPARRLDRFLYQQSPDPVPTSPTGVRDRLRVGLPLVTYAKRGHRVAGDVLSSDSQHDAAVRRLGRSEAWSNSHARKYGSSWVADAPSSPTGRRRTSCDRAAAASSML